MRNNHEKNRIFAQLFPLWELEFTDNKYDG